MKYDEQYEKEYKLSLCIPQYNNSEKAELLVRQLLSNPNPNFQVVVSDDCSQDGTLEKLHNIDDERLKVMENPVRLGAKRNWMRSLQGGDGGYLYLVMGRDRLAPTQIDKLLSLLCRCEQNNIYFALDRKCRERGDIEELDGVEACIRFFRAEHPTGLIIHKRALDEIDEFEKIFDSEMAYPEILLKKELLKRYHKGAIVNSGVFIYQVNTNKAVVQSQFEHDNRAELFFFPSRRIQEFVQIVNMVEDEPQLLSESSRELFFSQSCDTLFSEVSFTYKAWLESYEDTAHYRIDKRFVGEAELLENIENSKKAIMVAFPNLSISRKSELNRIADAYIQRIAGRNEEMLIEYKYRSMMMVMYKCEMQKNNGVSIAENIRNRGGDRVAIYGFSVLGQLIYEELKNSPVNVLYAIDRNCNEMYADIDILSPEDELPDTDMVIISLVVGGDDVRLQLEKKYRHETKFISVEELVYKSV